MTRDGRSGRRPVSDATYAEIARLLPAGPPLCLTTHESPDGDAIGSLLGAGLAL